MAKSFVIKQIMSIEPGWYVEDDSGPEDNRRYAYTRVIGLYLIEVCEDEFKSDETFPLTGYLSGIDVTELENWRDSEDDAFSTPGPLVYLPEETRGEFYSGRKFE